MTRLLFVIASLLFVQFAVVRCYGQTPSFGPDVRVLGRSASGAAAALINDRMFVFNQGYGQKSIYFIHAAITEVDQGESAWTDGGEFQDSAKTVPEMRGQRPSVATDDDWFYLVYAGTNGDIYMAKGKDPRDPETIKPIIRLPDAKCQAFPQVVKCNNLLTILWQDATYNNGDMWFMTSPDQGDTWTIAQKVVDSTGTVQTYGPPSCVCTETALYAYHADNEKVKMTSWNLSYKTPVWTRSLALNGPVTTFSVPAVGEWHVGNETRYLILNQAFGNSNFQYTTSKLNHVDFWTTQQLISTLATDNGCSEIIRAQNAEKTEMRSYCVHQGGGTHNIYITWWTDAK